MVSGSRFFGLRGTKLNVAVGVIAGLDFLLFGYDQGVMGGLLTLGSFLKTFPEMDVNSGTTEAERNHISTIQGISVASYNVGCFCGAVACIWVGNMLGRRWTIFVGSAIMVVGAALQCSAFGLAHFIIGRIITGVGNGLNTSTVPTWQSETSKSHRRGQLVMIEGALITGGICISYWLDFGFSYLEPSTISWRFPIGFQIFFALIILLFILSLPESPRWLILKGREEEAMEVLCALNDTNEDDQYIQSEFLAIKDTVLEMAKGSFSDLFTMGKDRHLHRTVLAYVNQMFQQISGINLITYYAANIYENYVGLSPFISRILAACNGTEYFLVSWIPVFIIEKFGRRSLMLFGAVGMSLSMVVLAIANSINEGKSADERNTAAGIVAAAFLFVFNSFFAVGWLGMTWLYPAEIVPLRIRAPANALATSANWAFNFMVVMITPVAFSSIGYQTYIIFAVINAFIVPVTYFFYPETAYRSLEEMDTIFHKTTSVFDVVKVARELPRRFGKNGELLIDYNDTEEAAAHGGARRRSSAGAGATGGVHGSGAGFGISNVGDKVRTKNVENVDTPSGGGESSVDEKGVEK
ncbi:putative sugar transporter stl1 protein [Lasiodiplodia theobromae]|uniref:Sugar transporter n=1 Tax=Lasiodiplodia theobromae TaxID=45133 RepID=UPI0015C3F906|nr:Sugar transporter [Lasiodiplodia theobromae]KAF4535523.1 Sugar transporter [Lasiodiplodia theobromae]KAF9638801.1 putative sugar transporter stl1 protein [Lasiodiplodia theobromae]